MIQQITYVITTNKNIRCYGCVDKCEKILTEKYVETNTFRAHMQILKKIFSDKIELHFAGGEPLLHKNLEELCEIAHQELPNAVLCIHTNGILMNTLKDEQLLNLTKNNNVKFSFYLYPIFSYIKNYQKKIERFQNLNIDMYWTHEHIYFNKYSFTKYGDICKNILKDKKQLLIVDNKIYPLCPFTQTVQYNLINNNFDYIEIDKLKDIKQIEKLFSQINCSHCKKTIPLSNLYINNYDQYEKLMDYVYDLQSYLNNFFFYENIQKTTSSKEFEMLLNRYVKGILDVFIPFSKTSLTKEQILEFKNLLLAQQDIEKINLYFICIDEDIENQQYWFELFESSDKLNTYFFKSKSLYLGIKKFFENQRLRYCIFDLTKFNELKNTQFFLNIINNNWRSI